MTTRDIVRGAGGRASLLTGMILLAVLALCGPGCMSEVDPLPVRKTHLGVLPEGYRAGSVAVSEGGDAYAFVLPAADGDRVVGPEGAGPLFARCERPDFAGATTRLYYWARPRAEEREDGEDGDPPDAFMLVADGTPVATGFASPGTLVLSDDGTRWAALGIDAEAADPPSLLFYLDGVRQERWVDVSRPVFGTTDADGAGGIVMLARAADGDVQLVVDGEARQRFASPEVGCAAAARPEADQPDLWRHAVSRLADGGLLTVTRDAEGWGIYRDDVRLASYGLSMGDSADSECMTGTVVLLREYVRAAPDAPVVFWWERDRLGEQARWRVMRDGAPVDEHRCDDILRSQPPEIGPDGRHYAYGCFARDADGNGSATVIQDGTSHGPYAEVWGVTLSADGRHLAYGAVELPDTTQDPSALADPAAFTWSFYRNGVRQGGRYDGVWRPRLDADGRHMAWQAKVRDDGAGVLGLDERRITEFDEILWGPIFEDGHVAWVIRRGRRITRIDFPYGVD